MAMKKSTPGRAGTSAPISSSVKVLGGINWALSNTGEIRKGLTPAQMKEAAALAARIKAIEVKAANDKKVNAKIIDKQNKQAANNSKPVKDAATKTIKPVIKVTPPRGGAGLRGGMGFGGGSLTSRTK
jgi:hypothetical protein